MKTKKITVINKAQFGELAKNLIKAKGKVSVEFEIKYKTYGIGRDSSEVPYVESVIITEE